MFLDILVGKDRRVQFGVFWCDLPMERLGQQDELAGVETGRILGSD